MVHGNTYINTHKTKVLSIIMLDFMQKKKQPKNEKLRVFFSIQTICNLYVCSVMQVSLK